MYTCTYFICYGYKKRCLNYVHISQYCLLLLLQYWGQTCFPYFMITSQSITLKRKKGLSNRVVYKSLTPDHLHWFASASTILVVKIYLNKNGLKWRQAQITVILTKQEIIQSPYKANVFFKLHKTGFFFPSINRNYWSLLCNYVFWNH